MQKMKRVKLFLVLFFILSLPSFSQGKKGIYKREYIKLSTKKYGDRLFFRLEGDNCWLDVNKNGLYDRGEELKASGITEGIDLKDKEGLYIYGRKIEKFNISGNIPNAGQQLISDIDVTHAPSLLELNLHNNLISEIDLSQSEKLEKLTISSNNITSLDFSSLTLLKELDASLLISYTDVLDLSPLVNLEKANLTLSSFSNVKLDGLTHLKELDLSFIDIAEYVFPEGLKGSLEKLNVTRNNLLKELDLSDFLYLKELKANDCILEKLYLPALPTLVHLECAINQLKDIDLSSSRKLEYIELYQNKLSYPVMQKLVSDLNTYDVDKKIYIINTVPATSWNKNVEEKNLFTKELVSLANKKGWNVYDLNGKMENAILYTGSENILMNGDYWISLQTKTEEDIFVTIQGENLWVDANENLKIDDGEEIVSGVKSQVSHRTSKSLRIYGTSISSLKLQDLELTDIDLSRSQELEELDISDTSLQKIDLRRNKKLKKLILGNNKLSKLIVKNCTLLEEVDLSNNKLYHQPELPSENIKRLILRNNQINVIDLQAYPVLEYLAIDGNRIDFKGMQSLVYSLNKVEKEKRLIALNTSDVSKERRNKISQLTIEEATKRNWNVYDKKDLSNALIKGEDVLIGSKKESIALTLLPDKEGVYKVRFKGKALWIDLNGNKNQEPNESLIGDFTEVKLNLSSQKELYLYGNNIYGLYFEDLKLLQKVDITKAKSLTDIDVSGSEIEEFVYEKNLNLENIDISENKLKGDFDFSKFPRIKNIYAYTNDFTSIDVSACTSLRLLSLGNNRLSSIDLSNNKELIWLYLPHNQLKDLDVEVQKNLVLLNVAGNRIEGKSMDALVNTLNSLSYHEDKELWAVDKTPGYKGQDNKISSQQVKKAKEKAWVTFAWGDPSNLPYEGYDAIANKSVKKEMSFRVLSTSRGILLQSETSLLKPIQVYSIQGELLFQGFLKKEREIYTDAPCLLIRIGEESIKVIR